MPAIAADYGDPDMEFRDFVVSGVPASGPYRPLLEDGAKWCERLGLPHPSKWRRPMHPVRKDKLREHCHRWIETGGHHKCTMDDVV
jgi:hypothetical protein